MTSACPGKLFVFGEYACLDGYPALVAALEPGFSLAAKKSTGPLKHPFVLDAPVGRFLDEKKETLGGYELEWQDHFGGIYGLGSSSAQFVLAIRLWSQACGVLPPPPKDLLQLYWQFSSDSKQVRPSGLDLICQWQGHTVFAQASDKEVYVERVTPWESSDAELLVAFTGEKTPTYQHLRELRGRGFPERLGSITSELNEITKTGYEAWKCSNPLALGESLTRFQQRLFDAELGDRVFLKIMEKLWNRPGVYGAKGCGAQGGDCILVLVGKSVRLDLEKEFGWKLLDVQII